jgi:hypothetical protein
VAFRISHDRIQWDLKESIAVFISKFESPFDTIELLVVNELGQQNPYQVMIVLLFLNGRSIPCKMFNIGDIPNGPPSLWPVPELAIEYPQGK